MTAKCPKCQAENPKHAKFCCQCAYILEVACSRCGRSNPADSKFCSECGYDLTGMPIASGVDYARLQSYTPTVLADKIVASRQSMEGERKQVTVLFADVTNFTSISEKLDPEDVHDLVSEVMVFLAEEVHRYEGTIAQFLGDGIMAIFGAPIAHEDAPQRALHAALGIRERVREHAAKMKPRVIEFNMHIGLNTGLVVVGRIGDDLTMEYTALGDTVNLASRMQSTAAPGTVRVAESTHRLTQAYFDFRPLGQVEVKGKKQPVKAYELVSPGRAKTRLGASVARGLTPFVGRKRELEQLWDCYQQVQKGQGQVVGIVGEPGVGKSRLLLQMRETLPRDEYTYIEGGCFHYGDAVPYLPLLNILRYYFGIDEGEPEPSVKRKMREKIDGLDQRLEIFLPPLHDIFSLKVEDEPYLKLDPPHRREKIFESIRNLLLRLSQDRPLVLAVEDLHWMDKTSEEFLGQFITSLAHNRIFVILLYRPEYVSPWTSKTYYTQIRVDELSQETSSEMVQAMLHEGKAAPELQEIILSRAAGNPLFIEELTRSLLDRGFIQRQNGRYILAVRPSDIQVPETVQAIIGARLDRLEENLKRTMQVASVIGRTFSNTLLQAVLGDSEDLKSHLADLQASEFVYEERLFPEPEYVFKHALTQDVAYNSLLIKRRKEIHEMIGGAVEGLYPDRLEELCEVMAHHYASAEHWEKAFEYLKMSGNKASGNSSYREALRFYREAIGVLNKLRQSEDKSRKGIDIRLQMATSMQGLAYPEDSLQILKEGVRLCEELNEDRGLAKMYSLIGHLHVLKGNGPEGLKYAEEAFDRAAKVEDVELMACLGADLTSSYNVFGESAKTLSVAPRAVIILEKAHREPDFFGRGYNPYSFIMANQGRAAATMGGFGEGEVLCSTALRFAEDIRNPFNIGWAQLMFGWLYNARGDGQKAVDHACEALQHLKESNALLLLAAAGSALGWGYYFLGDLEVSRRHAREAIDVAGKTGIPFYVSLAHLVLGMANFQSGDPKSARISIERSLKLAQEHNEKWIEALAKAWLGRSLGATGNQQGEAERLIIEGIQVLEDLKSRPFASTACLLLAELYADIGDKKKALSEMRRAEASFSEMGMDYYLARTEKALEKLKAQ